MTTQYLENHKKELEAIAAHYESHDTPVFKYRAERIRALIQSENIKND